MSKLINRQQAAEMLGVCLLTLGRITDLPRVRIGSRVLYTERAIDEWIRKREAANLG